MSTQNARLIADRALFERNFDVLPFAYEHNLSDHELLSFEGLRVLAAKYVRDFYVSSSAATPDTKFYDVPPAALSPLESLDRLDSQSLRVLLKRPELYDERYGRLMHDLFEQVREMRPSLKGERIVRLASSILISSSATITPLHFDPEISFFFQIAGDKHYHLYSPGVLSEPDLERFHRMGIVNIGQVDLRGIDAGAEHVFRLSGGTGVHQPENCPHWVETLSTRSISYVFSFETETMRSVGRTRAFNHYMRAAGLQPLPPGVRPARDERKAAVMQVALPLRKAAAGIVRGALRR